MRILLKKAVLTGIVLILYSTVFLTGAITGGINKWFVNVYTISVTNGTRTPLKEIIIRCKSGSVETRKIITDVLPTQTVIFEVLNTTLGFSYKVEAIQQNGNAIKPIADYVVNTSVSTVIKEGDF